MPTVGGVFIRDDLMPRLDAETQRPGYGELIADAAARTVNQVRYGVPYALRRATGNITPEAEQIYRQNLGQPSTVAPASVDDLTSGRVGLGRFTAENLAGSLPYMVGGLLGGIGGFAATRSPAGAAAGAIAGGTPQFVGSNVDRAVAEQGGLSEQAAMRSLAVAPLQSAADVAVARFLPGAGKILGDAAATQAGGFLRRTAASIVKAGATEAVTEAGQQVGERFAAGQPLGTADAVGEYVNAAVTAFAVGGVLGAGGGFRRTPAVSKPAAEVTNEDLAAHTAAVLSGEALALPSPQMFGREPQGPEIGSGATVIQDDRPNQLPDPDFIVDPQGRIVEPGFEGEQALAVDRNLPQVLENTFSGNTTPAVQAVLDAAVPPRVEPLEASTALSRGLGTPELPATNEPPQVADPTEDVPFAQYLDEQKKGLRGGFVQSVTAADEMELANKVYDQVFTEQDTRGNTAKFAQRVGILDEQLQPTLLAQQIEAERAVTPAAAPTAVPATSESRSLQSGLTPEVEAEMRTARAAAGIQRVTSTKGLDTPVDVFRALANDVSNAETSQVEKLAQKLGLITDDDARDVTPKGRQVYLTSSDGLGAVVDAAQEQGFTGAQASVFERGVRSVVNKQPGETQFTSFDDMAAHEAGAVWARDFVENGDGTRTAAQTDAIRARQASRATGTAAPRGEEGSRRQLTADQVRQQAANNLLDLADLRRAGVEDVAGLFRMVREGASTFDVGKALESVQAGRSVFQQPASGVPRLSPPPTRGQPLFREINTPDAGPTRAAQRASTAKAVETKRAALRGEIDAAYQSEDITAKERLNLIWRLTRDDFKGVVNRLPGGPLRNDMDVSRRGFLAGVAATAATAVDAKPVTAALAQTPATAQLRMLLNAGDVLGTLRHVADNSTNVGYRVIARKLLAAGGWERVEMRTQEPISRGLHGTATLLDDGTSSITLFGAEGTTEETVLHELIHAFVQQRWAGVGVYTENNERIISAQADRQDKVIRDFQKLWDQVGGALKATNPELIDNESWAANFYSDPDEALAWMMTNQKAQDYLRSVDVSGEKITNGTSLWDKFVEWLAQLLGSTTRQVSAFDELLRAGHGILDAGAKVPTGDFSTKMAAAVAKQAGRVMERRDTAAERTAQATNEITKKLGEAVDRATANIDVAELGAVARRTLLGWLTHNQIDRAYGQQMPGLLRHSDAHRERTAVRARFEQMGDEAYQQFEKLERENKNAAEWVGQLMALTTEFQIDPSKAWEDHKHIDSGVRADGTVDPAKAAEAQKLKRLHKDAVELTNKMRRGDGAAMRVFNEFRALNEAQNYARMAAGLHSLVALDPELTLGVNDADINPVDQFMREGDLTTAEAVRARWSRLLQKQIAEATAFVDEKKGEAARGTDADVRAMSSHLSPVELQIGAIHEALAAMRKAPYFHLGRFGDYFGSATVRKINGQADPAALQHVAETLEKSGFGDVQISTDSTRPKIALRFDTLDQAKEFQKVMQTLRQQKWLDPESEIKVGPRSRGDNFGVAEGLPDFVQRYIQAIEASPMYTPDEGMDAKERAAVEKAKGEAVRLAIDTWLEQQPDSSISKVLIKRYTVPGYNKDMIRNFAHRWRVGSISLANVAAAPKFNQAFVSMRSQVNDATTQDVGEATKLNDILTEMKVRDASNPLNEIADTFDKARAFAHAYFLGMSPAYGLVNMTQLGVVALPELAKTHGYAKSFHAMRRASTAAFKVLKAVASEARQLGWKHWADVAITENVLAKAGLSASQRAFTLQMLATGTIDIGSAARALGQIAEDRVGSKIDTTLKYAAAMGMYTETFSRLTTALAAQELHGSEPGAVQYATKVVSNAMFDYQTWNTARQLGKQGFAGPVTPLLTQFMSYSVQLTEKLYSEAMDAFTHPKPGESAAAAKERQQAARRFLTGHLVAVTALAGTLGLPFATVFASVLERMVDQFDDDEEPFDATAAWRGFLADVLGKDVGEVLARGLPRAFGLDLSARAGEQNLIPFSEFIADRRPWKEAWKSALDTKAGAVASMINNIVAGGGRIADGDVLAGMKEMLPVAFKGPIEVYRMTQDGYVDTKGNKMPLSPTAGSYLWQLIGFSPDEKAEYQEARGDQQSRRGEIGRDAERLRKRIVQAMIDGDSTRASELIREAQEFDQDNPAFAVIPSLSGALTRQVQARSRANALSTPLGVSAKDVAGQQLTRYANVDYVQ